MAICAPPRSANYTYSLSAPNGEIADDLTLRQATVKTHVKHILSKLDLRDRVRAVVLAYEAGLVTPGESAERR